MIGFSHETIWADFLLRRPLAKKIFLNQMQYYSGYLFHHSWVLAVYVFWEIIPFNLSCWIYMWELFIALLIILLFIFKLLIILLMSMRLLMISLPSILIIVICFFFLPPYLPSSFLLSYSASFPSSFFSVLLKAYPFFKILI